MSILSLAVLVAVVLLVVVAVAALLVVRSSRRKEEHRAQAGELRGEAAVGVAGVEAQQRRADELEREAAKARERADLLEERAREQRVAAQQAEAEQEDAVRRADALDPDVDHRADDYRPDLATPREVSHAAADADHQVTGSGSPGADAEAPRPTDPHDPDFDAGVDTGRPPQ